MKVIFVENGDWNCHFESLEQCVADGSESGEIEDGTEFTLVRIEVFAATTYRMVDGKPTVVALSFPGEIKIEGANG